MRAPYWLLLFTVIAIDLCISKDLLISAVLQTPLSSNIIKSFKSNHLRFTLIQKTATHLKGNKICAIVNMISVEADFD